METLFGSLVLHAKCHVQALDIPVLHDIPRTTGQHVIGRYNGKWTEANSVKPVAIYLPQRYKHLLVSSTAQSASLTYGLEDLDSKYEDARQLYKLNCLLGTLDTDLAAVVNIASAVRDGSPVSGSFYLLSKGIPLYANIVFDLEDESVQLAWATFDIKKDLQSRNIFRYVFFPLPLILDRPVFVNTQNLCSYWWKFTKTFGTSPLAVLKAANALELHLYKDPQVVSYERGTK